MIALVDFNEHKLDLCLKQIEHFILLNQIKIEKKKKYQVNMNLFV